VPCIRSTLGDAFDQFIEVPVDQRDRASEAQDGEDRRQFTEWFSRIEQNDDEDQIQGEQRKPSEHSCGLPPGVARL
jgi:hypothetical protein